MAGAASVVRYEEGAGVHGTDEHVRLDVPEEEEEEEEVLDDLSDASRP